MQKNLSKVGLIILMVLVVMFLYNHVTQRDDATIPDELTNEKVTRSPEPTPPPPPGRSDSTFERPVLPLEHRSAAKREGEGIGKDSFDLMMESFEPCDELLEEAVSQGNPNPNTAALGGCNDLTPLHIAKNISEIQSLLDAGADPNVQDAQGRTPLHMAMIQYSGEEVMMALLNAGADPDILDNKGRDAAMALMQRLDPQQASHVQALMWSEVQAEATGMTMDEFYKAHPHWKTRIDSYKPRDQRLENRMLVELRKAGSFGRALRQSFQMNPAERREFMNRVFDDRRDRILMRTPGP